MEIKVTIENIYGRKIIYPACEKAQTFAKIAGHKTLTLPVIEQIKKLGYAIAVVQEHVTL